MFILASKSPSRKKILKNLGYNFSVQVSHIEEFFKKNASISENAIHLATIKAQEIFKKFPKKIIIGCDSIMSDPEGNFLEKPKNLEDARNMMQNRSGKKEILVSGIAIFSPQGNFFGSEETILHWKKMSDGEIEKILDTNEWKGKCGGIMIEGFTGLFISRIEGNFSNVMGFPVNTFWEAGKKLKINSDD